MMQRVFMENNFILSIRKLYVFAVRNIHHTNVARKGACCKKKKVFASRAESKRVPFD